MHDLQVDHIVPFARGGDNSPSNLRLLCGKHNRLEAERVYGKKHMEQYVKEAGGWYLSEPMEHRFHFRSTCVMRCCPDMSESRIGLIVPVRLTRMRINSALYME